MLTINLTDVQQEPIVVASSLTASLNKYYVNTASATYTDPTPVQGKGFIVFVRNGTATVGGTGYSTAGTVVFRYYHSGAWANYNLVGGTPTLAQVLASDNKTNEVNVISNNGRSKVEAKDASMAVGFYDAVGDCFISAYSGEIGGGFNEAGTGENIYFFFNASGFQITSATKPVDVNVPLFNYNGAEVATVTDLAGYCLDNDSRLTDSRYKRLLGYQNTDSSVTGTTNQTVLCSLSIPANTMGVNDVLMIESSLYAIGTAGTKVFRAHFSTTDQTIGATFSAGGTTQAGLVQMASANVWSVLNRKIANKNSQTANNAGLTATSSATDSVSSNTARTATNIDFTIDQWVVITCQLANIGDGGGIDNVQLSIGKAS